MCSVKHNDITWALYYKMGGIAHFFCKLPKIKGFLRKISRVFAKVLALGLGGKKGPEVYMGMVIMLTIMDIVTDIIYGMVGK